MKILIEGERYSISSLVNIFDDPSFYHHDNRYGIITSVGYYHSYRSQEIIYLLPKVFLTNEDQTVFGMTKDELFNFENCTNIKHRREFDWIRHISIYFYNSLLEFKKRQKSTSILRKTSSIVLNTNLEEHEYSYLDLVLSFVNFYKKNKNTILFKHIESTSKQQKATRWEKTIRNSIPFFNKKKQPIYSTYQNTNKAINYEEVLLTYFISILTHINLQHNLTLDIDKSYKAIKGEKFNILQSNGLSKLRKIKHRYFDDTFRAIYRLCEIYFSKTDKTSNKKRNHEYVSISNYNLVFEDMVDKLFSDTVSDKNLPEEISLKKLKYQDDGKVIDHIFDHQSLLDTSNIFYIGDSKYYKSNNQAGKISKYKQITYAKNVIQYNIDLLNDGKYYKENLRYRDDLTEGYNITPNFFIYGYIDNYRDFDNHNLINKGNIVTSFHFKERLFDRDTLFVHQYKINFLFVLKTYSQHGTYRLNEFRKKTRIQFRENFVKFFNNKNYSNFEFFQYAKNDIEPFIHENFRIINGKCFKTSDGKLILAKHIEDKSTDHLLPDFNPYTIT